LGLHLGRVAEVVGVGINGCANLFSEAYKCSSRSKGPEEFEHKTSCHIF
jgi:hypothetical protein